MVLKHFMLVAQDGKRCLLLRFVNESKMEIGAMQFVLTQKDKAGRTIATDRIKYRNLRVAPDEIYSRESGIVVRDECDDFEVRLVSVISGPYKYTFKNGRVVAHFDKRGYSERASTVLGYHHIEVVSRHLGGGKFRGLVAFLSVLMIIGTCLLEAFL